jgi:tetratricopeptide (TPR) repeat protein
MNKVMIAVGLCLAMAGTAVADDTTPAPQDNSTKEKAGTNESLQNGGDTRPWAAGVTVTNQQAALKLFHDGNVQLNDGLFAKAADVYRQALTHWDHPAIHYNLALALMNLDNPIEAYENMQAAVKYGEAPLQSKDKFDNAKQYVVLLEKSIAEISVSCDKVGAKVTVDGKEAFVAPGKFSTKVRVGKHTFVAEKQGYTTRINAPYIGPGEKFRIELKLYTSEELTRYHRKWQATWVPWTVMGIGAVVVFGGALSEFSAENTYAQYDHKVSLCNMNNAGCPSSKELTDLRSTGDSRRTLGYVGYGVGAGALLIGATLAYLNRPEAYQIRAEDLQNERVSVTPILTPGGAGAALQGHF